MENYHIFAIQIAFMVLSSNAANILMPVLRSNQMSNSLNPTGNEGFFNGADWVQISEAPPRLVQRPNGAHMELECEAVGSPSPTIQWLKGDSLLTENDSYETNSISEPTNVGLSKIKARLVINNILPVHQGPLTCMATSGSKTAVATTNLVVSEGKNFSEFLPVKLTKPIIVRIVLFNTVIMEPMGSDLIIPCKAIGGPKPDIFWFDANEQLITGQNPRIKVLPDGELHIQNLVWSDMGAYTCVARNAFSKDTISTFIYPLLNEN